MRSIRLHPAILHASTRELRRSQAARIATTPMCFFSLLTDAYLHPAFDAADFERIKNDTINSLENTLRYASDEELGKAALTQLIFTGTRYAHPVQGTVEGLRSITLNDVADFYARHYTAANATLGLAGGYDDALVGSFRGNTRRAAREAGTA